MATIYGMLCPDCGHEFEVMKGILVSECGKKMPKDREEDEPFVCPKCGKRFCTHDDNFYSNVQYTIMAD